MFVILLLSQRVAESTARVNPQCLKLMSMYRSPKGASCCHLTSNRKRSSHRSGTRASVFQNMYVCSHSCVWGKALVHPRTLDWSSEHCVRRLCVTSTCVFLFICVRRFIAEGTSELATAVAPELIRQLFNQETYGYCLATKPPGVACKILLLNSKIPPILYCLSQSSLCRLCVVAVHEPQFKFPAWKTVHQLQFVKSVWIYAEATHLLLCLLKRCSNRITVVILTPVERKTFH